MKSLRKVGRIYGATGGMLVVLILLTVSLFYVVLSPTGSGSEPEINVTLADVTTEAADVSVQGDGRVKIAIIGDGFSKEAFNAKAQQFMTSMGNVPPYGDVASFFEFIPVDTVTATGCASNIDNCIYNMRNTVVPQVMSQTGAAGVVILSNGGGISSTFPGVKGTNTVDIRGPAVINTATSPNLGWIGIHEFLGHMVGTLNDRYLNAALGGSNGVGLSPNNCSRSASGESWWKTADPNSVPTLGCETPDTYAPYPNDCPGPYGGSSKTVMSGTGNCNTSGRFDPVEEYYIRNFIIPYLPGGSGGGTPTPPAGGVCGKPCTGTCPNGGVTIDGIPHPDGDGTGQCGVAYESSNTPGEWWACTGDRGWVQVEPGSCLNGDIIDHITGACITNEFIGSPNASDPTNKVCGSNKKEYQCQGGGWIETGKGCGPGGGGGGGQYTMTATVDKPSYRPGDKVNLCYKLSVSNVPYKVRLSENGQVLATWDDDGNNGGGCTNDAGGSGITISQNATPGTKTLKVEALINNAAVASASVNYTVAGTGGGTPPTNPPVTNPPVTNPPVTNPPVTNPPVTNPPVTNPPITNPPVTNPPTTITTTVTVPPTTTPPAGSGKLIFSIKTAGIGNSSRSLNNNPQGIRSLQVRLLNPATGAELGKSGGPLGYDSSTGTFKGSLDGPAGSYDLKVRTDNSLWKDAGVITVAEGATVSVPVTTVIAGDLNQDNILDLKDYTIFLSCYGTRQCSQKQIADLNMDTKINELDLNIFYAGLSNRQGD